MLESKTFTLTFDIGHSYTSNRKDESFIMGYTKRLKHFHIHDATINKDHRTLGSGEIDLKKYIFLAKKCRARCVIEIKTIESLKKSVE